MHLCITKLKFKKNKNMGTSNFSRPNASKVFACLMGEDVFRCGDCVDTHEWDVEDFIANLRDSLAEIPNVYYREENRLTWRSDNKRNIATLIVEKVFAGVSIEIVLGVTKEVGYYEGAQLDWELTYYANGYENDLDPIEEWKEQALYDHNLGLVNMVKPKVGKWLETAKNKLIEDVEKVSTEHTTPLIRVATFSNGESIYQKA